MSVPVTAQVSAETHEARVGRRRSRTSILIAGIAAALTAGPSLLPAVPAAAQSGSLRILPPEVRRLLAEGQERATGQPGRQLDISRERSAQATPGVELSTCSLGHGLGVAAGMALAAKRQEKKHRVFCMLSDGECDEGSNWEAILFAAHHELDNLIAVIDYNNIQSLAAVTDTLALEPLVDKWEAFGWSVRELDGHDHNYIKSALGNIPDTQSKPS